MGRYLKCLDCEEVMSYPHSLVLDLGCVHIEIYGIRYMVFAIRYTGTAVHIEVARAVSVLFSLV